MKAMRDVGVSITILALSVVTVQASPFTGIGIGDIDGFGLGSGTGLFAANGGPANVDGMGLLGNGDFLPDWNRNGTTHWAHGDDFDYRSAAETGGAHLTGSGYTDTGSTGSQFTDISLSQSYDTSSGAGTVHVPGGTGSGGPFPTPPSTDTPNQPGFVFDFFVAGADIVGATPMFFNLIYGDYDSVPAEVMITRADGTYMIVPVSVQPPSADGLIQSAAVNLTFGDIFQPTAGGYDGYLRVDFVAPNEPYTAFDFVELSTRSIVPDTGCTSLLLSVALMGIAALWRRFGK